MKAGNRGKSFYINNDLGFRSLFFYCINICSLFMEKQNGEEKIYLGH